MRNIFILAVLALFSFVSPVLADGKPVVKIGISVPLSGDNAHLGESARNAMTMAKDDMSKDTKFDYELVFEDDGLEAKRTAGAVNKLISVDHADALVSLSSGTGGVVSPIAEQNKVIHFGIASAQKVADGDYNFIHWTSPSEESRAMVEELKRRNISKIAIFVENQAGFIEIHDRLKDALAGTGIEAVSDEMANPEEKDFRGMITKARDKSPQVYVLLFYSPGLEVLTKQMHEAGIKEPITGIESFGLSGQMDLYEGQWYIDAADASGTFNDKYTARFKKPPVGFGGPNSYDIFNLLVYGFEHAPASPGVKPSELEVAKTLQGVKDFDGVLGKLSIDDKGVVFSPATVKVIKDGKSVAATN